MHSSTSCSNRIRRIAFVVLVLGSIARPVSAAEPPESDEPTEATEPIEGGAVVHVIPVLESETPPDAWARSFTVRIVPGRDSLVRLALDAESDARVVLAVRSHPPDYSVFPGVRLGWLVAGPLLIHGMLAELANPGGGGPASPRWYEPARVTLDGGLEPTTRLGASVEAVPWATLFAWHAGDTTTMGAGVSAAGDGERLSAFVETVGSWSIPTEVAGTGIVAIGSAFGSSAATHDPRDEEWFAAERHEDAAHLLARFALGWHPLGRPAGLETRLAAAACVSVPGTSMPGISLRGSLGCTAFRDLDVSALLTIVSPDFRDLAAETATDAAFLATRVGWDGDRFAAAVEGEWRYEHASGVQRAIGIPGEWPALRERAFRGRLAVRTAIAAAASVRTRAHGAVRLARTAAVSWNVSVATELGWRDGLVNVGPSAAYDSVRGWRFGLDGAATLDAERAPGLSFGDAQLSVSVDTSYEPSAASSWALRCAITFGTAVSPK